ncbi:hypothetical protein ACFRAQ_25550 [Nocardia sp. NPDC056611]|uniref:hypothetical protein n=1 Tax=Nocardia sp. NPDC056611 TaxID=3345877 RepID=UPI0036721DB6
MVEHFWPENVELARRSRAAWAATVESLPVGSPVTGKVIGRQPFGVFIEIDQIPDAIGLVRVTFLPTDAELPARGELVEGHVHWHESHNCQVIVMPSGGRESDYANAVSPERLG